MCEVETWGARKRKRKREKRERESERTEREGKVRWRGKKRDTEVDGGKGGQAGVLLRGSVVKRIDPNHYDMSRLRRLGHLWPGHR